jgi:hypothetical protein
LDKSTFYLATQAFIALGTVVVAILAIWGERIRALIAGPNLEFKLHNPRGNLTERQNGRRTLYYHIKIENKRRWALARRVRVLLVGIAKRASD